MNVFYLSQDPVEAAQMHCDQHVRKMLIESAQLLSTAHRMLDGTHTKIELVLPVSAKLPVPTIVGKVPVYMKKRTLMLLQNETASLHAIREAQISGKWYRVPDIGTPIPHRLYALKGAVVGPSHELIADKWNWLFDLRVANKRCCIETHINHPQAIWVRSSIANYMWLFQLYRALNDEFKFRWGKDHACWLNWNRFLANKPKMLGGHTFTEPPQTMPEQYKQPTAVLGYRSFYCQDKSSFAKWTTREQPTWYQP